MKIELYGLIAAPFTPMNNDGSINYNLIPQYVDYLSTIEKVENLFILGTTGEGLNLTTEERKKVAEKWIKHGKDKMKKIIVHIGCNVLSTTKELAVHAQDIGADGVAVLPPTFYKPSGVNEIVNYVNEVAKSVPTFPIMYYHLPEFTGVKLSLLDFLEEASKIPNFCGMKYVVPSSKEFSLALKKYGDYLNLCYGKEENTYFISLLGCDSFVGGSFSYTGKYYSKIIKAVKENNHKEAQEQHYKALEIMQLVTRKGFNMGMQKMVMKEISSIDVGPPRKPLLPLCDNDVLFVQKTLKEVLK